ncbi:putative RDD family membrane protein YckC [Microbacterium sp. W4I4]|uniref:RDD family protein n=1 Tax=Microbacterium sp. W4I4 TaxID=3042295 RepID=UPI0027888E4C|nr:RDD family protein [Microbacterium sp. W4I4]MDQ0614190.1 putative RDD family membrane protein YckC [Microbacterium sp. W4I4]
MTMLPFGDPAPIRRRAVAYIIDALIAAVIPVVGTIITVVAVTSALRGPDPAAGMLGIMMVAFPLIGALTLAWFIVYTVMQSGSGSIGMRSQGLRLAGVSDGSALGFGRTLLRNVIWGLAGSIVVGYFTVLFDGSGRFQGWHDKVAGSVMLDQRALERGSAPQFLDSTQPPLVPGDRRADAAGPAPTSMPGFGAPQAPQTSMPGFGQAPGAFPPPSTGSVPPQPVAAPAAPPFPAAASQPAAVQPQDAEEEFAEHTVLSPRIHRDLPDDPLISFVPGVTQEPLRRPVQPEPVQPEPVQSEPVQPVYAAPAPSAPVEPAPQAFPAPVTAPTTAPDSIVPPQTAAIVRPAEALPEDDEVEDIESTRISVPGHRLVFTWDDGQRATVSGRTIFGRNPEEPGSVTNVAVRDETRSLSKTHFEAGANAQGGWVLDRQSTNGTTIVREGVRIACPPGQRVPVRLGDALEIGDRIVTIGGYV